QVLIETGTLRLAPILLLAPTGERNDTYIGRPFLHSHSLTCFVTVHAWHADVHEHDVRLEFGCNSKGGSAIVRNANAMAHMLENDTQGNCPINIIINNEDLSFRRSFLHIVCLYMGHNGQR